MEARRIKGRRDCCACRHPGAAAADVDGGLAKLLKESAVMCPVPSLDVDSLNALRRAQVDCVLRGTITIGITISPQITVRV